MRVLIIIAIITLSRAAPRDRAAHFQPSAVYEDAKVTKTATFLGVQRYPRSTEDLETTTDDVNEGVSEANDLSKEIAEEARWAAEEKKWQEQAKAETMAAKLDGEAASTNTDDDLAEESLWLADEQKWDDQESEGTVATELEGESKHEEGDLSDPGASNDSLTPAVLAEGVDLSNSKDVETVIPELPTIPNNFLTWIYPNPHAGTWLYQLPQYYHIPAVSSY